MDQAPSEDVQARFCATLVDEWLRHGVTDAVVCPGSRSTPITLALADAGARLRLHVVLDERSAAFRAVGFGMAAGRPAVLVCTSGTAAANFHPAVAEAHHNGVPLLVCTADRPPELHHVGAPQTLVQQGLFGGVTRWAHDPGVADLAAAGTWRSLASRAFAEAVASERGPGPVHLNLPFREPLVGDPGTMPPGRAGGAPWHRSGPRAGIADEPTFVVRGGPATRGILVAGGGTEDPALVLAAAAHLGWPVLADPRSGCRIEHPNVVAAADALLREPTFLALASTVEMVVRVGRPWASKVLGQWLAALPATTAHALVDPHGTWADPERLAGLVARELPEALDGLRADPAAPEWLASWRTAERAAQGAIDSFLAGVAGRGELTEPAIARGLVAALPDGATLVVSSSMPVRDVEWFGAPRRGLRVLANRGVNGIDGVVSTALGVALANPGAPTACLIGDLAFLHDSNWMLGAAASGADLACVVVDNGGGGIFSFLPQALAMPSDRFEHLFGTPQPVDIPALVAAHAIPVITVQHPAGLAAAVATHSGGVRVIHLRTEREANVAIHDELNAAVAVAVSQILSAERGRGADR